MLPLGVARRRDKLAPCSFAVPTRLRLVYCLRDGK